MIEIACNQIDISASANTVFDYISNMENYGAWFPGVIAVESGNHLPHASVGKTYIETIIFPEGERKLTLTVYQSESNRLFVTRGDLEGLLPQMTITLSENQTGRCQMALQYHSRNPELTETSDMIVMLRKDLTERSKQGLQTLKQMIEAKVVS